MFRSGAFASAVLAFSLAVGMAGYHQTESLPWLDAFDEAAMILSGMGPLSSPKTVAGKLFAGCYALYSGIVFVTSIGIVGAPLLHRLLHSLHLEEREEPEP
jgi:hypothetical protein